ncbi:SPOR domain-containing protein [Reichenbachiella agariperforans]|uniref:SPOR domain-containing protein n=1 Tax=Reichenbachiella agariperforans TaxID=156994 RepID=UPI001C0842B1|nr:SPOR domain-containing protein [Reichenbachiella agariperforans]MBU2916157.1 hypothetical protein [Reichenbachiella agariperforans]
MAEDKLNEGSEEEKKASNDLSDDDFGLPDLEFDELQELDLSGGDDDDEEELSFEESNPVSDSPLSGSSDDIDMSVLDEIDLSSGSSESVLDEGIEEVEDVLDSAQLISDRLGDDEEDDSLSTDFGSSVNYDDLIGGGSDDTQSDSMFDSDPIDTSLFEADTTEEEDVMSSDDLFASIDSPDDLAALGMADDDDDSNFSIEDDTDSDSLFSSDSDDSLFDSDNVSFGVDDDSDDDSSVESDKKLPENYKAYTYNESSGGFTKIIVIGVVVIAVIAAGMLWLSGGPEGTEKKVAKVEKPITKPKVKKEEPVAVEATPEPATEELESVSAKPELEAASAPAGEIVRVTERTGVSYIVIASFIDDDLAMDYAKELSAEGKGVKVISPFGNAKRFRVSVADYSTYGDAASQLGSFKSEYGDQVWALKY